MFLASCQCKLRDIYNREKVTQFASDGNISASSVHAYLSHMQRHIVRKDQGKGNKCSKCCLWFNQKSLLMMHQRELHDCVLNSSKYIFRYIPRFRDLNILINLTAKRIYRGDTILCQH